MIVAAYARMISDERRLLAHREPGAALRGVPLRSDPAWGVSCDSAV